MDIDFIVTDSTNGTFRAYQMKGWTLKAVMESFSENFRDIHGLAIGHSIGRSWELHEFVLSLGGKEVVVDVVNMPDYHEYRNDYGSPGEPGTE